MIGVRRHGGKSEICNAADRNVTNIKPPKTGKVTRRGHGVSEAQDESDVVLAKGRARPPQNKDVFVLCAPIYLRGDGNDMT